ncbi:lipase [Actinoplanes sp. OR16]|uniref:SGNH/GDSL hydrolase family protein n=1 Tax=Actinoplanes sp. OR16 TaxID=946334 RepID=UPI000F6BB8A9|nr:SGNH/GDSL hydrolase family protein [Actinoplanes sp. OR16]BBH67924.1 lipase [Actinoplanes sp. OR16]
MRLLILGAMLASLAGTVVVIAGQARGVQRIVPVAMQPPPRAEGLIGSRFPGPPLTMVVLGDSFACGYGAGRRRETVGVLLATALARHAGRPVRLRQPAFVGAMSADLPHQVRAALTHEPDVAVIFVGGNDVTRFASLGAAARHLGDAVRRLRATGCHVIVGTCPDLRILPPLRPPLRWLASLRSRWLAAAQTAEIEAAGGYPIALGELLNPFFEADPVRMFGADRFHPSPAGYARTAAVCLPPLLAALRAEGVIPQRRPAGRG